MIPFLIAAGLGALIGLERQLSEREGKDVTAGARTFALYATWGAFSGYAGDRYGELGFAVLAALLGALIVVEYRLSAKSSGKWGTTSEVAALASFGIGVMVWAGEPFVAGGLAVGVAALLRAKDFFHGMTMRFSDSDVRIFVQFAVLTAVILPVLPDADYGPFGFFNPRRVWLMVVFVSAIGLVGYVALRLRGQRGLALTGFLGGLVSSTAVTLGFSRMSKDEPRFRSALIAGIVAASGLMYLRVLIEAATFAVDLARILLWPLVGLFVLVEGIAVYWWLRPQGADADSDLEVKNPLTLSTALQFGALYSAVIFVSKALHDRFSDAALSAVGAISGINDVDAITLSMADLVTRTGLDPVPAAKAVLAAVVVNTVVKAVLAAVLGDRKLAVAVGVALLPAAVIGGAVWVAL